MTRYQKHSVKSMVVEIDRTDEVEEHDSGFERDDDSPNPDTSGDDPEDREGSPIPEGQYEVEEIRDYMKDSAGELYYVKWKGWEEEHNTWEPPSSLMNCQEALMNFFVKREAEIEENTAALNQNYIVTENGTKRRKGSSKPKLCLPPDPRPLWPRIKAYYDSTRHPTVNEVKEYEAIWKSDFQKCLISKAKKLVKPFKGTFRWQRVDVDRALVNAMKKDHTMTIEAEHDFRKQIFLQERDELRMIATEELAEWIDELNEISDGKPYLKVENNVDWEGPPKEFTYINDYVPTGNIIIPDDPIVGCSCTDCYVDRKLCCPAPANAEFAYTVHKKVRVIAGTPIYECNSKCACGPECPNRVVQDGRVNISDLRLCIFRTSNGRGWGVRTMRKIKKNTFVSLYLGEIITSDEAEKRGKEYDRNGCTYLFDLDINDGKEANRYTVDATKYGNITHFINHSCDPNLAVYSVFVNCLDPDLPKLALFATRDISSGEELSFDYEYQVDPDTETEGRLQLPCYCGSTNCRKYFF